MQSQLKSRFEQDLERLSKKADTLQVGFAHRCAPERFDGMLDARIEKAVSSEEQAAEKKFANSIRKASKNFPVEYQAWYSEALMLIKQLLPEREADFRSQYEKPKAQRKSLDHENYVLHDALQGLTREMYGTNDVGPTSAIARLEIQVGILKSARRRFESSLFDLETLVQADLLDSELASAQELLKRGFLRAAGAVAGVVLERHLAQVTKNRGKKSLKKAPSISDWNELLKKEGVIDTLMWRKIQHLGDIRNLCDHNKDREPTKSELHDLLSGVEAVTKNLI